MRNERRTSGSGRGGEKPVAEGRHGARRLLLHLHTVVDSKSANRPGRGPLRRLRARIKRRCSTPDQVGSLRITLSPPRRHERPIMTSAAPLAERCTLVLNDVRLRSPCSPVFDIRTVVASRTPSATPT